MDSIKCNYEDEKLKPQELSTVEKMRRAKLGERNFNYGLARSEVVKSKISESQKKRHARNKYFAIAEKSCVKKRVLNKTMYNGQKRFKLLLCHESASLYEIIELPVNSNKPITFKVAKFHQYGVRWYDFNERESAMQFYNSLKNPLCDVIYNETKKQIMLLIMN